eukprot:8106284-Pyramimonas_sp.AAC.1
MDPDDLAKYAAMLPLALSNVPGGGLGDGVSVEVQDGTQQFETSLTIKHTDNFDELKEPDGFRIK